MTMLRSLQVEGNRLRSIQRSILDRGTKALLEYLESRIPR
uniref:Plant intracellular ras-group-related lrr protein 6-like n=1 Tax=Tetraselmis sp. GSL018 TaxID=582737 RepID=A0A061QMF4_9CHLO